MKYKNWNILCFEELSSTNDEAHKFCLQKQNHTVIKAVKQTAGRGRRGRIWQSCEGNLFFSMVLEFDINHIGQLVIASSLSVLESILEVAPHSAVSLKWPNDVLLNNAKVCGILLEKGEGDYIIVGVGVNIKQSPDNQEMLYPCTSLREKKINISAEKFLKIYLDKFSSNLQKIQTGDDLFMREKWLKYARGIGEEIIIKQENTEQKGIFVGINENGNLLLKQEKTTKEILVGDVFYIEN